MENFSSFASFTPLKGRGVSTLDPNFGRSQVDSFNGLNMQAFLEIKIATLSEALIVISRITLGDLLAELSIADCIRIKCLYYSICA